MRDKLIIQSVDDAYLKYLDLSSGYHRAYAEACDADYLVFIGRVDPAVHPAWNRVPMMLRALRGDYRKVVWIDADSIVVDPTVSIFDETADDVAFQMTRVKDSHVEIPGFGQHDGWDVYNDGILVANDVEHAHRGLSFVWAMRSAPFEKHHHPTLWELNWLLDYVGDNPDAVREMSLRFNWMPYAEAPPEDTAVIRSYHGYAHEQRFADFRARVEALGA